MQAQMTSINSIAVRRLRSQNSTRPLPKALVHFVWWTCKAHLLTFPLLLLGPFLLAPVFDGDANTFFMITPSFVELIRTLLRPIYEHFGDFVSLQVASVAISITAWLILRHVASGGLHWSVHGFFWLIAGLSSASILIAFAPFGLIGLLIALTLLIWVVVIVFGTIAALGGLIIAGAILCLVASIIVLSAVGVSGRRHYEDEDRYYQNSYEEYPRFRYRH